MSTTIHKISLDFSDLSFEKEFRKERINRFIDTIKIFLLFAISVYVAFITYDYIVNPLLFDALIVNRLIVVAYLVIILGLSFTDTVRKNYNFTYTTLFGILFLSLIHTVVLDITHVPFLTLLIIFFTLIPFISFRNLMTVYIVTTVIFFFTLSSLLDLNEIEYGRHAVIFMCGIFVSFMIHREKQNTERLSFLKTKWSQEKNEILKKDKKSLQNQAALASVLQKSVEIDEDLHGFLQEALNSILDLPWLNVISKGSISLTNDHNDDIIMVASKDLGVLTQTCAVLKPGQCLCGKAIQQKKLLFNKCVTADHDIRPDGMTPHGHYNIPLKIDTQVLGVLNIYVEHNHIKTEEEVEFLTLIADTLASVVYRHKLEDEKKQQKIKIEEAYDDINQSIEYAQRIQNSLLSSNHTCMNEFEDMSIFFMARDVVSGDFYLAREANNKTYISVADCTGHGVPGALVSALGIQKLAHIVTHQNGTVGSMLDTLNIEISKLLNNDNQIGSDGMDLSLLCIDKENRTIEYSGAKGIFYLCSNKGLTQHKMDRVSIGDDIDPEFKFTTETLTYNKGDIVYLLTDGFIDQLSQEDGKRIGSKKVKELFNKISPMNQDETQDEISDFFEKHMSEQQTDDITLISFKLC